MFQFLFLRLDKITNNIYVPIFIVIKCCQVVYVCIKKKHVSAFYQIGHKNLKINDFLVLG